MSRVAEATESSPYTVTPTAEGFDLRTDIGNKQWLDRLRSQGVAQAHLHRVAVEVNTYGITSDSRDLSWGAGVPVLATPRDVRKAARGRRAEMATDGPAAGSPVADDALAFDAGRRTIVAVGEEMGLIHRQSGRRLEIVLTAVAIIATVAISFAVAVWVLFLR